MTTRHHISHADELYFGNAYLASYHTSDKRGGIGIHPISQISLGSPIAADADNLIKDATSTELPNNSTKTYTVANDGSSPVDNAARVSNTTITTSTGATASVFVLDVPRNITVATSTAAADTVTTVTGYDVYGVKMVEAITVASGDSAAAGKKAFKYVESIAIYSAGDITSDTLTVGFGDVLGLPVKAAAKADVMQVWFNDALDSSVTVVKGDATTATATTGDVRGTVDPNSSCNGSPVVVWLRGNPGSTTTLFGVAQYGG